MTTVNVRVKGGWKWPRYMHALWVHLQEGTCRLHNWWCIVWYVTMVQGYATIINIITSSIIPLVWHEDCQSFFSYSSCGVDTLFSMSLLYLFNSCMNYLWMLPILHGEAEGHSAWNNSQLACAWACCLSCWVLLSLWPMGKVLLGIFM